MAQGVLGCCAAVTGNGFPGHTSAIAPPVRLARCVAAEINLSFGRWQMKTPASRPAFDPKNRVNLLAELGDAVREARNLSICRVAMDHTLLGGAHDLGRGGLQRCRPGGLVVRGGRRLHP